MVDAIVLILQQINKSKADTICLALKTYELVCPTLPQEKVVRSPRGPIVFIHVSKQKLADYLKEKFRLFDVSRDIQKIKASINNHS